MFERFTEPARRVIFFARYEASTLGSGAIEPVHLLLALFREDQILRTRLTSHTIEAIRRRIEETTPRPEHGISTSVDLPVSKETQRALALAMEEADSLNERFIDSRHLGLGLLGLKDSLAGELLRQAGITPDSLRSRAAVRPRPEPRVEKAEAVVPGASSLAKLIVSLETLIGSEQLLDAGDEEFGSKRLKRISWSRKEALGHLIDYAIVHHTWVARALTEPKVSATGYPDDSWVSAQQYNSYPWLELVNLWVTLNRLILHVWHRIPEGRTHILCRIGIEDAVPLSALLEKYVQHCDDIMGQILARL